MKQADLERMAKDYGDPLNSDADCALMEAKLRINVRWLASRVQCYTNSEGAFAEFGAGATLEERTAARRKASVEIAATRSK